MLRYFAIFKPYGMLSQFTSEGNHPTLANLDYKFPKDVYPIGRLDADSEGLLLLTNDKRINSKLLEPANRHDRKYLIQVEGKITTEALEQLQKGITINEKGKIYRTLPARAMEKNPENIFERNPPVRFRKNIPTSWLELILSEGKNRQVRRMTASVGFPALRLIRTEIEGVRLGKMENGWMEEIPKMDFYSRLKLGL